MNGKKFSLLTIIYLFILTDLFLCFYIGLNVLFILVIAQLSWIVGLLLGLKGQGHHKIIMYKLLSIADDPRFDDREELRGHRLKQQIRHDCLEYDFWFINKKNKKKTKNFKGGEKSRMKEEMLKDLLYLAASIWAAFGLMFIDILVLVELRFLWIIGLSLMFYAADAIFWIYLFHYWNIKKEDVTPAVIPPVII